MTNVTSIWNGERKNSTDKKIANISGEREYVMHDKDQINNTLFAQLNILNETMTNMHIDSKTGKIKNAHLAKHKEVKKNVVAYSSMTTVELLGYLTNKNYFIDFCGLNEADDTYVMVILGTLVFLSMKQDINPYIDLKLKPIILVNVNDYNPKMEKELKRVFKIIKNKLDLPYRYE